MRKIVPRIIRIAVAVTAAVLLPRIAPAQSNGADLFGRVTDPQGGALPGVSVTANMPTTGLTRSTTTGGDGSYRIQSLPAGSYTVTSAISGFKTLEQKDVVLFVATPRQLDMSMQISSVAETITVSTEVPLARAEPTIGAIVTPKELETLPLNGRQFANAAVLAPGTQLSYNSDPTKPGQLTISLDGGSGRNVNFVIDGGDNTDDTIGGALQNFALESVQEFKMQTMQYKAEYGRSSGGVLNVVTKGGTNDFHGSVFEYFRDKSLNSEDETEKISGSGKQAYRRNQYGASLGGPIMKDRAHFFVTAERTERRTNYSVDTSGVFPNLDGTAVALPFRDELVTAKATADLSAKQFVQVRFGYQKNTDKYGASSLVTPDSLGTVTNKYTSFLAGHQMQIGNSALNEILFQYTKFENGITPDSTHPALYFPSGVLSGENFNTPQHTFQKKYQYKDDFSFSHDLFGQSHDFKLGINYIHEPELSGDFSTGVDAPQYTMANDDPNGPVHEITRYGGFLGQSTPVNEFSAYIQDDWRPSSRLTVNLGLRYDLWLGFDLNQQSNPIYQELSTQTTYNEEYLREFQGWNGKEKNDKKNWGPRLGFSYDLTGEAKNFVHGGWGIYYDFPYVNATLLFPASAVQSNYGVAYDVVGSGPDGQILNPDGSDFHVGDPLPPNQVPPGTFPPNEVMSPTQKTPFSRQFSIGASSQVMSWLGLSIDYTNVEYRDIPFRFRANPRDPATGARRFPDFGNFRIWMGNGKADYKGVNLGFQARVSDKVRFQGFYTLSRATGNVLLGADEFRITGADAQPDIRGGAKKDVSVNPLDPNCSYCYGPLYTDARHKVTLGGFYSAPWGINVSGLFRYRSATAFMIYDGRDLNGDGFKLDLPAGHHVNEGRAHSFEQFDLSLSKEFLFGNTVGVEIIAQVFNIFNAKNPSGYRGARFRSDGSADPSFNTPSRYAGDPGQGEQRLLQLGAKIHF